MLDSPPSADVTIVADAGSGGASDAASDAEPGSGHADVPAAPPRAYGPPDRATAPPAAAPPAAPRTADQAPREPEFGRPPAGPGDGGLWVPRVLFFPLWAASEYLVRQPFQALIMGIESEGVDTGDAPGKPPSAIDLAFAPAVVIDAGYRPMFGAYGRVDNVVFEGVEVRGVGLFGGPGALKANLQGNVGLTGDSRAWLELGALHRDDLVYWGTGPRTLDGDAGTFSLSSLEARVSVHVPLLRGDVVYLDAWMRGTATEVVNGTCGDAIAIGGGAGAAPRFGCAQPTLLEQVAAGTYRHPAGVSGYAVVGVGSRFGFDTRPYRSPGDSGLSFEIHGEQDSDVESPTTGAWLRFGGTSVASVDVTGTDRVLSLRLDARFAEPYGSYDVPMAELVGAPTLHSDPMRELLRGFRPGRLLGESATAVALEYRWPIWTSADAHMETGLGNAFGAHLHDFAADLLRFSLSGGIEIPLASRHRMLLLAGFGTETFADGADPTSARIYFGGTTPL